MDAGLLSGIIIAAATVLAAIIAKEWGKKEKPQTPSVSAPRKLARSNKIGSHEAAYAFVSIRHVLKKGVALDKIISDLIAIDYQTIRNIEERDVGSLTRWRPIVEANLDCWGLVTTGQRNIVGYWHFNALRERFFKKALQGSLHDGELTLDAIEILVKPGHYHLYVFIVAVVIEHRGCVVNRLLLEGFCRKLIEFAALGIFFDEIVANAYTDEGLALCNHLGMDYVCDHKDHGKIYRIVMNPLPDCFALVPELRNYYLKVRQS